MGDGVPPPTTKQDYLAREGMLLVLQQVAGAAPDIFIAMSENGAVDATCGHVDLGTGSRTALAQIVAEELDVALERVTMVLGHTALVPDQGATIASATIQVTAVPLRQAAAQARHALLDLAAAELETTPDQLVVDDGIVRLRGQTNRSVSYGELLKGRRLHLERAENVPTKSAADYRLVGQPAPRVDIPDKATGRFVYVHDVRLPGMLHGRVVRPPYAGRDSGDFVGRSLLAVDEASVRGLPGLVQVVVLGDFVGIVAEREEQAIKIAEALAIRWKPHADMANLADVAQAVRANPSRPRKLLDKGDVDSAIAAATQAMARTYVWPYQMHASIGPSCAVADWQADHVTVWSGTQNPHHLRRDIAILIAQPEAVIEIIRHEAAGCYGRNCADDVAGDAVLLSRAVGRPVRVQLTREQEHAWEPKGAAQVMDVNGGLDAQGNAVAYDFSTRYPSNMAPLLALLLTGRIAPIADVIEMGDRTCIGPYDYPNMRVVVHDMAPLVRSAWFRGVSALPNSFAHESYIDELATAAGVDPVVYRLRYLKDARAVALVESVAARAGWVAHEAPQRLGGEGDLLLGQGFAYAVYVHSAFPGYAAAWAAWVADVAVNKVTGEVAVTRVVVGQDSGLMINPAGVQHQIHGNVIQATSRALKEEVTFDRKAVTSREWGAYPIITFPEVPVIDVLMMPRQDQPPLGAGESASVPSAAAIANAIFDATGVRFREPPFTPARVKAGLAGKAGPAGTGPKRKRRFFAALLATATTVAGIGIAAWPWRGAIEPIPRPDPAVYSAATLARGKILAALGNCAVCHTTEDGIVNAGGRALHTPFGVVMSTNITPDVETGIGAWSYPAFERAMREGIHRDGHRLYPAFPYPSYTKTTDADLQALYAYLMAQPAVRAAPVPTKLAFPFNLRTLMAGWNALFLRTGAFQPDPARSAEWNRGAYLAQSLGHCGACHSPRNVLGAEKGGRSFLAGGFADGWEAPALTALSAAPVPWSEDELFAYLRTGKSVLHGTAAGPMAPVVRDLANVPEADVRALAVYLASASAPPIGKAEEKARAAQLEAASRAGPMDGRGARLFDGACAVCHDGGTAPSLALNSNVHSGAPDNLVQIILNGSARPASGDPDGMPAFAQSFDDGQVADLVTYVRQRFGGGKPGWDRLDQTAARIRAASQP